MKQAELEKLIAALTGAGFEIFSLSQNRDTGIISVEITPVRTKAN